MKLSEEVRQQVEFHGNNRAYASMDLLVSTISGWADRIAKLESERNRLREALREQGWSDVEINGYCAETEDNQ